MALLQLCILLVLQALIRPFPGTVGDVERSNVAACKCDGEVGDLFDSGEPGMWFQKDNRGVFPVTLMWRVVSFSLAAFGKITRLGENKRDDHKSTNHCPNMRENVVSDKDRVLHLCFEHQSIIIRLKYNTEYLKINIFNPTGSTSHLARNTTIRGMHEQRQTSSDDCSTEGQGHTHRQSRQVGTYEELKHTYDQEKVCYDNKPVLTGKRVPKAELPVVLITKMCQASDGNGETCFPGTYVLGVEA
ncbi:hypothetical protein BKA70DRAFT_1223360 [Coprinopsis sp. MPI-PUGE-AT-0042]|nr:hypothetical protein BKA70DRAFT_1223360 [Coprinopsis sp. MPI-PUGE-AT-0042]